MNHDLLFGNVVEGDTYEPKSPLILRSIKDYEVLYLTSYNAPTTGGGTGILPAGELIRVNSYRKGSPAATCKPLRYDDLHESIVSNNERLDGKYTGYYLVIPLSDLDQYFEQLNESELEDLDLS